MQIRTAEIARNSGARVFVRSAIGREVQVSEFDAVVIIDADSVVDSGILRAIGEGHDWLQGYSTRDRPSMPSLTLASWTVVG